MKNIACRVSRLGETGYNNFGTPMKIIRYYLNNDITVEFQDEYQVQVDTTYGNFSEGKIKNPYDRTSANVGYLGEGKYKTKQETHGKLDPLYMAWRNMIMRCYDDKSRHMHEAYKDCTVCEEWHNLQNFGRWYEENIYSIDNERMHVDKDILIKGNKVYSPETCLIIPQRINMIFMNKSRTKDKDLPNAIYRCTKGYRATYNGKSLGVFKTLDEAVKIHDDEMRLHIKTVAKEYKDKLPPNVYISLLGW